MEQGGVDEPRGAPQPVAAEGPPVGRVARVTWSYGDSSRARRKGLLELPERAPFTWRGSGIRRAPRLGRRERVLLILALFPAWLRMAHATAAAAPPTALLLYGLVALTFGRAGLLDALRSRERKRRRARLPGAPWAWERVFDTGVVVASRTPAVTAYALAFAAAGASAAAGALAVTSGKRPVLFVAPFLLSALYLAWQLQRAWFRGSTELRFGVPCPRTDGDIVLEFAVCPDGSTFRALRFDLLRLVQVPSARGLEPPAVACTHGGRLVPDPHVLPIGPGDQIELRFTLPSGAGGNELDARKPVLWELVVEGETSSGPYAERFPVPIYDVPESVPLPARE